MNYIEHIFLSLFVNGALLLILHIVGYDVELSIPVIVAFFLFTLIPDIDHRHSVISRVFFIIPAGLFLSSALDFYLGTYFDLISFGKIALAVLLFMGHLAISKDDHHHRSIPHSLVFGAVSCFVFLLITGSILATLVAVVSFVSHVLSDKHISLI